ncbi:MAG TPA: chemotaxis protein CheW [Candidatus Acidoferrales bacterium]|nr:chemotaxis protein CheW [Candidatus Acidoferrales bacterium]
MADESKFGAPYETPMEKVSMPLGNALDSAELPAQPEGLEPLDDEGRTENRSPERQYCVFRAGRERYCLSVLSIEEVVDWPQVTRIPLCPPFLVGVFNLRGSIVPLVDIAFTEGRRPGLLPRHVVVAAVRDEVHAANLRIGIAADEVIGTYTAADDALLDQVPSEVPHCRGMLRHDDRLALVLDLPRMFDVFPVPVI